ACGSVRNAASMAAKNPTLLMKIAKPKLYARCLILGGPVSLPGRSRNRMRARVDVPWVPPVSMLLAASLAVAAAAAPPRLETQKTALVTVVAGSDAAQKDLTPRDFIVREDKAQREVTGAELATETLSIAILLDTTKQPIGMNFPIQDIRTALS